MKNFVSDGKKLLDVEYDDIPNISDVVDGMRVISKDVRDGEYALFLVEPNTRVTCYVLDEIYILGKQSGFESLNDAISAWKAHEI
ncbi:MAG: hypothetical protein RBR54_01170 [Sulfurimonas sp.]|jgi:hypothetical protein|nr:hypothetical protein [Helicobacteraceae bacterium]MDY0120532.1 hypothetical protein [Sulfurimonas sp.]